MRFINWNKIENCILEERRSLVPYIESLINLKTEFEMKGIKGFDEYIISSADLYEKRALQLIMQGYMPEMCEKVLFNVLNASNFEGKEYLKAAIFNEFILTIQKGNFGEQELKIVLLSYLGTEFLDIQMT